MNPSHSRQATIASLVEEVLHQTKVLVVVITLLLARHLASKRRRLQPLATYSMIDRIPEQVKHIDRLCRFSDADCIANLRMDQNTSGRLCFLLRELGGLSDAEYVTVEEQVAMFLATIGHHKKNKVVKFDFWRSGQTVSRYVHVMLRSVLKLHSLFLVKPEPVSEDCTDSRWKWFKGCLGALDGTYIDVNVRARDKTRYRTRKGSVASNVLAVCDRQLRFVYVLPGWEGSAADARVLRDAVNCVHGLRVPRGNYYLCDNGYANCDGFLAPYKGVRYHLSEWDTGNLRPQSPQEIFNMRHTRARNVIERAFGIMKMRWAILRSASYYPIKTQIRLILACFLLHNFIRAEMPEDPYEQLLDAVGDVQPSEDDHGELVESVQPTAAWTTFRDDVARDMWLNWQQ